MEAVVMDGMGVVARDDLMSGIRSYLASSFGRIPVARRCFGLFDRLCRVLVWIATTTALGMDCDGVAQKVPWYTSVVDDVSPCR
jgi:hypothetical protein